MIWTLKRQTVEAVHAEMRKYGLKIGLDEHANLRLLLEVKRHIRENWLWVIAFSALIISALGACAEWWPVLHPTPKIDSPQINSQQPPPVVKEMKK